MERLRLAAALSLGLALLGCGGPQRGARPAEVRFLIEPATARVYSEDRFVGAARVLARRPEGFAPGRRHFTITADGYFPHDVEVDLPSGLTTIRVRLRAVPP